MISIMTQAVRTKLAEKISQCGYPLYVLAAAARVHPSCLSRYQRAQRMIPPHHLARLAAVLGCDPDELIGVVDD